MPGIQIGHGAIIASRAVVTKNVEPYAIVGGNPAKFIRKRFNEETIEVLLTMAWWDWPLERLTPALPLLCSGNIQALHDYWLSWRTSVEVSLLLDFHR